ncbi:DsbA family protein [Pseudoduganella sp. LjRoot289]|uniref:DsbA family protein n=1 Tax=Pseudoduganella sp. LjRoot289 TaxID=3342314 RepID=UPI003ECF9738
MKLIYAGDPMCSWCYGFGKELAALAQRHPELQMQILVGGVRAGATDVLDDTGKQFRLGHWARVEQSSGLPFNRAAFLARENFVYDTEPVCRAVVAARRLAPQADQLAVFRALQHAFYVDGLDTTDGRVLSDVASAALERDGHRVTPAVFHAEWDGAAAIAVTAAEFTYVRSLGVRSFPALLLETEDGLYEVSPGYARVEQLEAQLEEIAGRLSAA